MRIQKLKCLALAAAVAVSAVWGSLGTGLTVKAASGKTYYVAADGKDENDGLSQNSPMSFIMASATAFEGGDRVLLKRGDVFYGTLQPMTTSTSPNNRVEIGTYGTGELPRISLAKITTKKWLKVANGFYRYDLGINGSYEGLQNGVSNVAFAEDAKGKKWGVRQKDAVSCINEYDFYCDRDFIYMKTSKEPHTALGALTLAMHGSAVKVGSNMNISDLHIKYSGGHGINLQKSGVSNFKITGCVIEDIGGAQHGTDGWTKFGNGIELYGGASNGVIAKNIIRNTYDVGFTCQGGGTWTNITVNENIFSYNTQALEIWTSGGANTGVNGLKFENNICINQGEGWGTPARPDKVGGAGQVKMTDVLVYGYTAGLLNISVANNVFYNRNEANRIYSVATVGSAFLEKANIDKNKIYLPKASSICMSTDGSNAKKLTFSQWQSEYNRDKNGSFTAIGSNLGQYSAMENKALQSQEFNDILSAVKAASISASVTELNRTIVPFDNNKSSSQQQVSKPNSSTVNNSSKASVASADNTQTRSEEVSSVGEESISSDESADTETSSKETAPVTDGKTPSGGLPIGTVIGIIALAVVILGGGGFACWYFLMKKRAK